MSIVYAIPSAGRASIAVTWRLVPEAVLCVPPAEVDAYRAANPGATVLGIGYNASHSKACNAILNTWPDQDILLMDDDLLQVGEFETAHGKNRHAARTGEDFRAMAERLFAQARRYGKRFWGVPPTDNAIVYNAAKPVSFGAFCRSTFTGYAAGIPYRFDENLRLKADYDYSLQAWLGDDAVRFNAVYYRTRKPAKLVGGCAYRTPAGEDAEIAYLRGKWGSLIRKHPRRAHEIIMSVPQDLRSTHARSAPAAMASCAGAKA